VDTLEAKINDLSEQLEGTIKKAKKFEDQIKDLEQQIIKVGGAKLLMQKDKVDGTKLHIKLVNDEITKAEVAKAKAEKDSTKLEESVQVNSEKLEASDAELAKVLAELKETRDYIEELQGRVDEAQEAADASKEVLDKLKEELEEKNEEVEEFRKKEVCFHPRLRMSSIDVHIPQTEIQRKVDTYKKDREKFEQQINNWQQQLSELSLEDVE
jgi:structural maintenance of chromosome 4